jgi:hypothetical protein
MFEGDNNVLLFPFVATPGMTWERRAAHYQSLQRALAQVSGVHLIRARALRNTRVNWLIRRSSDPEIVAQLDQHDLATLHRSYERPNHQRVAIEAARFWREVDTTLQASVGPGGCDERSPEKANSAPSDAPEPDCQGASGCLFCVHHRDIETFDHAWSLTTLRHLKSLEVAAQPGEHAATTANPALRAVERITAKLASFPDERREWIDESSLRITEGRYHPRWAGLIRLRELAY